MMERFPNLVTMFFTRAAEKGDAPFLWEKYAGRWRALSWSATAEAVARVAEALTELGLQRGDRVLLLSRNRREWCIADLGIMAAGGITVPAYVTGTPADQAHILADSGAKMAIVQLKQAGDLDLALARSPNCRHVIMIEPSTPLPDGHVGHNWSDLLSRQAGNVEACAMVAAMSKANPTHLFSPLTIKSITLRNRTLVWDIEADGRPVAEIRRELELRAVASRSAAEPARMPAADSERAQLRARDPGAPQAPALRIENIARTLPSGTIAARSPTAARGSAFSSDSMPMCPP